MDIHLPIDLESRQEFRLLRLHIPDARTLVFLFFRLWREFGYEAQSTGRVGHLSTASLNLLAADFPDLKADLACSLVEARLIEPAEGGYHCELFARSNKHLDPNARPMHLRAADVSAWARRQKHVVAEAAQQSLLVDEKIFADAEGAPLAPDEVRRLTVLVKSCDNALFRADRTPAQFTTGLVLDALTVLREHTEDEIQLVLDQLARKRTHPAVKGLTAEALLADFRNLAGKVIA